MNRISPDISRKLKSYVGTGMAFFGQRATWRKYISASAGNPDLGISDKLFYQERPAQMEFRSLTMEEFQMVGGQDIRGTYEIITVEPVGLRDEIVYNGETYRMISVPESDVLGDVLLHRSYVQRASVTGYY